MASSVSAMIIAASQAVGLDPALALAIGTQESGLNPNTPDGAAGEIGVMQIMPSTAPGVNLRDLATNIQTGVSLLAQYVNYFGDETSAIAAYNCGQQCVINAQAQGGSSWLSYIPGSTQGYVQSVLSRLGGAVSATVNLPNIISSMFPNTAAATAPITSASSNSLWTEVAIGIFVILGLTILISET